jgi:hypothetical protein
MVPVELERITMTKIHNWKAKRSGDAITVTGTDPDGHPLKVGRVLSIDGGATGIIAKQCNGLRAPTFFELVA